MSADHILALDSGTTSCRSLAFDASGQPVAVSQQPFAQHFPQPGWVEHDAEEIWETQRRTVEDVVAQVGIDSIAAIGITNQRETVVIWERETGRAVAPAIVWQCRRTAAECARLRGDGVEGMVRERTGLLLDPYFSATKIAWMLDHHPGLRARAGRGELAAGTIDTWLLWKLTGGAVHATDASNASRTLLWNLHTQGWDPELCELFRVPMGLLPDVHPHGSAFGTVELGGRRVAVGSMLGDQQAALFGQGCTTPGAAKSTFGTGCFLLAHAGGTVPEPPSGLLTTAAWQIGSSVEYALEGSVFIAGAAIQWLRDELGLIRTAEETDVLARSVPDTGGVVFVPAFTGLGAPWWDADARGILCGLTRGSGKAHVVRAALEGIAFQNWDVLSAMQGSLPAPIATLRVDGGASRNDFLMQFLADVCGVPVERPAHHETTALGAARMASRALGIGPLGEGAGANANSFRPAMDAVSRDNALGRWRSAVGMLRGA